MTKPAELPDDCLTPEESWKTIAKNEGSIEEYKALRAEILMRSQNRLQILGFTIAAVGAALVFMMRGTEDVPIDRSIETALVGLFMLGVINASVIYAWQNRRKVRQIGTYIRDRLEPQIGANWETWFRLDDAKQTSGKGASWRLLREADAIAICYLLMTISVLLAVNYQFTVAGFSITYVFYYCLILVSTLTASWFSVDLAKMRTRRMSPTTGA